MRSLNGVLVGLLVFTVAFVATGEEKGNANQNLALDAATAGPDFKIQGEYLGEAGGQKYGVQVIALGGGTFRAVLLPGGLPGPDGSDSKTGRVEMEGKTNGEKTDFVSAPPPATGAPVPNGVSPVPTAPAGGDPAKAGSTKFSIQNETLTGTGPKGEALELKKVLRQSPMLGLKPPEGALVLFDGTNVDAFKTGTIDERKCLKCGVETKQEFRDFTLHVEFLLPFKPYGRGQDRANSGVYIQRRYEIQVLDTFGLQPEKNYCGSVYTKVPPLLNMCFPPLTWQSYDIEFQAAKFENGKKTANAVVTVTHNGVIVHNKLELLDKTGAGRKEGPEPGPLYLQDHGNPVVYRNVWLVEKK